MTDESAKLTEPWIAKHEAGYPYAYDKGGKLKRFFGVRGIPHAVLIDATGMIVWRGHPAELDEGLVQEHLADALSKPAFEWPSASKAVFKSLDKGDFGKALEEAAALSAEDAGPELVAQVQSIIDGRVARVERQLGAGNFLDALEGAEALSKGLAGRPEQGKLDGFVATIERTENSGAVIDAQKKIRKLRGKRPTKRNMIEAQLEDLQEIAGELRDTYAAEEALAYADLLREKLRR